MSRPHPPRNCPTRLVSSEWMVRSLSAIASLTVMLDANAEWVTATPNQPFSVGDRIYTRDNSHASLAFSGRNFARLDPNTSLDVVSLEDRRTQLALRDGSAMFEVGYLAA